MSTKLKDSISSLLDFVQIDVWRRTGSSTRHAIWFKLIRIVLVLFHEIKKDNIIYKASATTYLSILSIVPLVAIVFGISKGFGLENLIEAELKKVFLGQEEVSESIFGFAQNMLDNTQGGIIVGVSIIVLFFTVMKLLNNLETTFNDIWGKQRSRNLVRKFTDYLALLVIAPILIILSSGVTIFIENKIRSFGKSTAFEDLLTPLASFFVQLSPFALIWLLFTLIFIIMPNVKVSLKSGIIAGIISGTLFQFLQWGFINFSFLMGDYGAVYGGLAALPLFFVFNQLSWTIIFIGGELSYAIQVEADYIPEEQKVKFSYIEKKKIALSVASAVVKTFEEGKEPYSKKTLSKELNIPHRFVSNAVNKLVSSGVLTKSLNPDGATHVYLPSLDIHKLSIKYVIHQMEDRGASEFYDDRHELVASVGKQIGLIENELMKSQHNKLLKDL